MSEKVNKVGERNLANNGQWMEIIEYINSHNITVKFEDGTIVYNKQYDKFKKGCVKNFNYNLNNRVGETNIATNGQKMTIIEYRRSNDIDVRFEDGTIVYHKTYERFKKGQIANPNYSKIGEKRKANNGQWMQIIEWITANNITVKFEDGTIVYNKTYYNFKRGQIDKPNSCKIGKIKKARNGQKMTIIDYINANNITIKFEDGTVVYNKAYDSFKKGLIKNPNYNPYNRVGEEDIATNGQKMTIIAYRGSLDIDVQFEDGTIVTNKTYNSFRKGNIENPNCKIAYGVSVNEFVIYYYLRKYGFIKKEKGSLKELGFGQMELDCYHPDYKIAIEYDGNLHELNKNRDKRKNKICKQNGITIIRIREPKCPVLNDNSIEYQIDSDKRFSPSFETTLKEVVKYINFITELNIDENISFEQDKELILKEFNDVYVNKDINSRLFETVVTENGQKMTIIAYRGCMDIDVQFEDGTIVYNKIYNAFKKGQIGNPNYINFNKRGIFKNKTGETNIAKNGQKMTIVAYRGCMDIDIQFEDRTIVCNKRYDMFKKGSIQNPNFKKSA